MRQSSLNADLGCAKIPGFCWLLSDLLQGRK